MFELSIKVNRLECLALLHSVVVCGSFPAVFMFELWSTTDDSITAEPSPLHTTTIVEKCTLKLVDEYKHMLCQATEPLSTFLEYITYVGFNTFHFFS